MCRARLLFVPPCARKGVVMSIQKLAIIGVLCFGFIWLIVYMILAHEERGVK